MSQWKHNKILYRKEAKNNGLDTSLVCFFPYPSFLTERKRRWERLTREGKEGRRKEGEKKISENKQESRKKMSGFGQVKP